MIIWEDKSIRISWCDFYWLIYYKHSDIDFKATTQELISGIRYKLEADETHMNLPAAFRQHDV